MIKSIIIALTILSLVLDISLWRLFLKRYKDKKWIGKLYLAHFILLDTLFALIIFFVSRSQGGEERGSMQILMWLICIVFMTLLPKFVYMIGFILDLIVGGIRKRKVRVFSAIGLCIGIILFMTMLWGCTFGRNLIRTETLTITSSKIPQSFDGYRIAFLSDVHIGNLPKNSSLLARLVETINDIDPDIVVNGGDLVNASAKEMTPDIMTILGKIKSKDGVYSVLGNHDLGFYMGSSNQYSPAMSVNELTEKQASIGWKLLVNESKIIDRGGDSIVISGLNYPRYTQHNGRETNLAGADLEATYANVSDSLFSILIAHNPNEWDKILDFNHSDLTLSGHVHAMQLKIKAFNWAWSPAIWLYDRWSGLYTEGERSLYITDGIGYVMYPIRVGASPELTVITLKHK